MGPDIFLTARFFSKISTLPSDFASLTIPFDNVAIPAESYPLYSNFLRELIIVDETGLLLAIPIIPHILFCSSFVVFNFCLSASS